MKELVKGDLVTPDFAALDEKGGSTIRVVSVRTGLSLETLRAWERRYGFPTPERRAGSNRRLYSAADVDRLVVIRRALDRGYRVGDVIGKTMLELESLAGGSPAASSFSLADAPSSTVRGLIDLLAGDRISQLESELRRAAEAIGPRRFVAELAHPFAVSVGESWASGRLSIRHEHVATECLTTQLRQMLSKYQDIEARPLVLLATLPGEPHTLALQMVALYLVVGGAQPRLLGGPTPTREVIEAARALDADVVGLTVTPAADRKATRKGIRALRKGLPPHIPVWVGGEGATALGVEGNETRLVLSWRSIGNRHQGHHSSICRRRWRRQQHP